jgi:hypothetical protein
MLGSPESPGYLAAKGKRDEAVAVATKLWGPRGATQLGDSAGKEGGARDTLQLHSTTSARMFADNDRQHTHAHT